MLLGHPRTDCGGARLESRASPQTMLLFAMLIMRKGEPVSRDELAFRLSPDLTESDARAALRRYLYKLQQALSVAGSTSWIVSDARSISWRSSDATWVDVHEFDRLSEAPETLEAAAKLYVGDFIPYLDHEWAASVRERLRRRACRVLEQLISLRLAAGDVTAARDYVEQLLERDSWREDAVRRLMILRLRTGDRAGALAYYRAFRERLRLEFDVEPMPETVRCYECIVRGLEVATVDR